ncbi:hypothetical protein FQR65_LT13434 [Abscondita terminalis]|nr:hypothetical protein FQR65_LT13434 [Abscondita terminalis]
MFVVENCIIVVNYKSQIYLEASCEDCPKQKFIWSMVPGEKNFKKNIDFETETVYGKNKRKLVIKKGVLIPGDEYKFYCHNQDKVSYAYETIKVNDLPKMSGECSVNPPNGQSLLTLFTIVCGGVSHTGPVIFYLYQVSNADTLLAMSHDGRFDVRLSTGIDTSIKLYIKISDLDNIYIIKNLTLQVTSFMKEVLDKDKMSTLMKKYDELIPEALKEGDAELTTQLMNALSSEMFTISNEDNAKQELKRKIIRDLTTMPCKTQFHAKQISSLNKKMWEIPTEHDRKFSKQSANLSQNIAKHELRLINEAPLAERLDLDVNEVISDVLWVANQSLEAFVSEAEVRDVTFIITTPENILTIPAITENYDDYKDADLDYVSRMRDYKSTTKSALGAMELAGLAVAKTLVPGEPISNLSEQPNVQQVLTGGPYTLVSSKLGEPDAQVIASPSLADINDVLHGVVTVFPKNPYWWHKDGTGISTKVLSVNYFYSNKPILNSKSPIQLQFKANWSDPFRIEGLIKVPGNITETGLEKHIAVHRIEVKQGGALIIDFYDVQDDLQMVITYNKQPNIGDFKSNTTLVSKGSSTHVLMYPENLLDFGNSWFYLSALPRHEKIMTKSDQNLSVSYKISFVTAVCSYWSNAFEEWISSDCRTGNLTNKERIQCFCTHHSSYAGSYFNSPNMLDPYAEINFKIKITMCWTIFISVLLVFFPYCILLIVIGLEPMHNYQKALFLTDNSASDGYYYLVVVKTGSRRYSGTTSNIGLKIFGLEGDSQSHLLNYPDPYKKLLQRNNKDRFVLSTSKSLKKLNKISLWFDSVGSAPSWYCEWISIVDLQNKEKWFFNVRTLFSVLDEGVLKASFTPSVKEKRKNWWKMFYEHPWNYSALRKWRTSYVRRLTVMLSTILTTYSVTLIMYGVPHFRKSDGFGYGHYKINLVVVLISICGAIVSFTINLFFVKRFSDSLNLWKYRKTWYILIFYIILNFTFLVSFGFWISYTNSLLWLTSTIAALIQIVLIFDTIYAAFGKINEPGDVHIKINEVVTHAKQQKRILAQHFGNELMRPMFINKYRGVTEEEAKAKREKEILRRRLATLIQDLIMFIVYIVLLFFITLASRDSFNVYSNQEIIDLLVTDDFKDISSTNTLYRYLNETFIKFLHPVNWYGSWNVLQPGLLSDFTSKILGVARIRQKRVCKNCCIVPWFFHNFTFNCTPEYTPGSSVSDSFREFWEPMKYVAVPRLANAWKYTYDGMGAFGYFKFYWSGGYTATLGRTTYNSYYNLQYYFDTDWIDSSSRALFIEFLSYNVDYNMFHVVTLIIERSASGLFYNTYNVISTRLLLVNNELEIMIATEVFVFVIIVIVMLLKNAYLAKTLRKDYVKDLWKLVDFLIIIMTIVCMGLYWHRLYSLKRFLRDLEKTRHNQFINYFYLVQVEYVLITMAFLLVCVATIRLWKFLRFIPDFKVFEKTLKRAGKLILGLAICHWIIWCMYAVLGDILFGTQLHYFHRTYATLTSLMLMSMNLYPDFDYNALIRVGGGYAYFYLISYALVMMTIYNFYVSLLMIYYTECNTELSNVNEYYSLRKHITDELKQWKKMFKRNIPRLSAGEDVKKEKQKQKITAKEVGRRYADSITLSPEQLLNMLIISKSTIDNSSSVKEPDITKSIATLLCSITKAKAKSEYKNCLVGYSVSDDDSEHNIMFDQKLLDMEDIVRRMLEKSVQENSEFKAFEKTSQALYDEPDLSTEHPTLDHLDRVLRALTAVSAVMNKIHVTCDNDCERCRNNLICYHLSLK